MNTEGLTNPTASKATRQQDARLRHSTHVSIASGDGCGRPLTEAAGAARSLPAPLL